MDARKCFYLVVLFIFNSPQASVTSRVAASMGLYGRGKSRVEFIRMKGPEGKGYAEVAVSRHHRVGSIDYSSSEDMTSGIESNAESPTEEVWKISFHCPCPNAPVPLPLSCPIAPALFHCPYYFSLLLPCPTFPALQGSKLAVARSPNASERAAGE